MGKRADSARSEIEEALSLDDPDVGHLHELVDRLGRRSRHAEYVVQVIPADGSDPVDVGPFPVSLITANRQRR